MISWGGQNFALQETREIQGYLEEHLSLDWVRPSMQPHEYEPSVNYQKDPWKSQINCLVWPTGAQRWARMYALVDKATKGKMQTVARAAGGVATLDLGNDVEAEMYFLSPRPVSDFDNNLWILPFVDVRYWWQYRHTGDLTITLSTTWDSLISTLGTQLGVTISTDAIPSAYMGPDPEEAQRKYHNVPALLDAVAHSIGMRVLVTIEGTVELRGFTNSRTRHDANIATTASSPAGGSFDFLVAPEQVIVAFRRAANGVLDAAGAHYAYENSPASGLFDVLPPGTRKRIISTAYADFTGGGGTPDNNSALASLASQITTDYYDSLRRAYDWKFNGVRTWNISGYDDMVIWTPERLRDETEGTTSLEIGTRVVSVPHNLGVERMLHQDEEVAETFSFFVDADTGPVQTIEEGETLFILSENTDGVDGANTRVAATDTVFVSHADTSALTGVQGTGSPAFVETVTVDALGHVTAVATTGVEWTANGDTGTALIQNKDTLTFTGGSGITTTVTAAPDVVTIDADAVVKYGVPLTDFQSGVTIVLDPTDADGVDNGEANVTVHTTFNRQRLCGFIDSTDICSWVPYDSADAPSGVDGVLIGPADRVSGGATGPFAVEWDDTSFDGPRDSGAKADDWACSVDNVDAFLGVTFHVVTRIIMDTADNSGSCVTTDSASDTTTHTVYKMHIYYREFTVNPFGHLEFIGVEKDRIVNIGDEATDMDFIHCARA